MDELIKRIADTVGISEDLAKSAVQIILGFLNKEGPSDQMGQLLKALPGADEMLGDAGPSEGGLLGGIMGGMGAMGAVNSLTSAGLDMGQVQGVTKEVVGFAKEKAGPELVDEIVGSIPGLGQFV